MVAMQRFKTAWNNQVEHYLYVFGGIKVVNETVVADKIRKGFDKDFKSSYEFANDMWRYDLISDQWENIEVLGIQTIRRQIMLWNGTQITVNLESRMKLREDLNNILTATERDVRDIKDEAL